MKPSTMHERLDRRGLLDAAYGSGVYALRVAVPDSVETVYRRWLDEHAAMPPDDALETIAQADRVAYVGAANTVYDRLTDHIEGEVRQAAYLRVFDVTDVVGVWAESDPFEAERSRAGALAADGWAVIVDGEVIG